MPSMWIVSTRVTSGRAATNHRIMAYASSETGRGAGGGEKQSLGKVRAQQPPAAASQRGANGGLSSPGDSAGHEQARNVQARDQEQARRGAQQDVQRRLEIADHSFEQRTAVRGLADEGIVRVRIVQAARDDRQLRRGLPGAHPRASAAQWRRSRENRSPPSPSATPRDKAASTTVLCGRDNTNHDGITPSTT